MDISDGLAIDLPRLCAAAGVGAIIDPDAIPCHPELNHFTDRQRLLRAAGDDYQLLLAFDPTSLNAAQALAETYDVNLAVIGELTEQLDVRLSKGTWPKPTFTHFKGGTNHV